VMMPMDGRSLAVAMPVGFGLFLLWEGLQDEVSVVSTSILTPIMCVTAFAGVRLASAVVIIYDKVGILRMVPFSLFCRNFGLIFHWKLLLILLQAV